MENLWKKRKPPVPMSWNNLPDGGKEYSNILKNLAFTINVIKINNIFYISKWWFLNFEFFD